MTEPLCKFTLQCYFNCANLNCNASFTVQIHNTMLLKLHVQIYIAMLLQLFKFVSPMVVKAFFIQLWPWAEKPSLVFGSHSFLRSNRRDICIGSLICLRTLGNKYRHFYTISCHFHTDSRYEKESIQLNLLYYCPLIQKYALLARTII